jgi:DNA-binding MarR family transcriptional regulator
MSELDVTRLNRALNKVSKLYRAAKARGLAELGLHPGQDVLLWVLAREPDGMSVSELAGRLGVEQPTVTRSLARMEQRGLFRREPVPGDRRRVRIVLTEAGSQMLPRIERVWADLAEAAVGALDPDDAAAFTTALEGAADALRLVLGDAAQDVLTEG